MASLAIIPARGGSKRIAKKNIKDFNGLPIIARVIQTALASELFDEVMVSTEDDEIAEIAIKHHAIVPFKRSVQTADDHATLVDVILEVIQKYKEQGKEFDTICCLLPTAALITSTRLKESFDKFVDGNYSSLVPVIKFSFPIQRALKNADGFLKLREPEFMMTRSQDLEAHYHDSGQFYWIKTNDILKHKTVFMDNTGFVELNESEAQDVDTAEDWEMLKIKYQYLKSQAD